MSVNVPWTGPALTAEQEFARLAYALAETHRAKRLTLDNYTPASEEPYITLSQGFYQFTKTPQTDHLIIVATLPISIDYARQARKPWLNVVELGSEAIPAGFGAA
jgi:hypothetical protein